MLAALLLSSIVVFAFAAGLKVGRAPEGTRRVVAILAALAAHVCGELVRRARALRARIGRLWQGVAEHRAGSSQRSELSSAPPADALTPAFDPAIAAAPAVASDRAPAIAAAPAVVPAPAVASDRAPAVVPAPAPLPPSAPFVASRAPLAVIGPPPNIRFDPIAPRGTQSVELDAHTPEWKAAMATVGKQFEAAGVCAIVFVHGTFTGNDPLSAYGVVERALPNSIGPYVARTLRKKTRVYIERVLGDLGNFGTAYVRLFEEAIRPPGARIPCTDFVWSSENHHVGRLEGALGLVRVLATHAELGGHAARRILVIGHSHAGQIFALATQLLARSIATEAIFDIARARGVDVAALETDIATLRGAAKDDRRGGKVNVDFVTFGAPNRYAWATVPNVRALHVIACPPSGARGALDGDWIRRLGVEGSDFPPLSGEDRRINALLADSLGHPGFAPARVATALRAGVGLPSNGELAFVEYGDKGLLANGLNHGAYTRLDAMLFHARLVAERLYPTESPAPLEAVPVAPSASTPDSTSPPEEGAPLSSRAWSAIRSLGPTGKSRPAP